MVDHQDVTGAAYDGVVELYASMFADRLETQPFARAVVATFAEQARVLARGGLLLVSFFATDGPDPVRFDHKVAPASSWPADRFAELLAGAGLTTFARLLHDPASERGFLEAHVLARLEPEPGVDPGRTARRCT
ncbi:MULTISPECIES: hypothetical protein [unclassified Streptomyces]|uniref:hypothetical protein n=1 Tax=unclassified Streptomyces TaxID=2593676 RepID=UPI002E2E1E9C|nr:hypothetical protein [Streptomyces sp. NBC_01439]